MLYVGRTQFSSYFPRMRYVLHRTNRRTQIYHVRNSIHWRTCQSWIKQIIFLSVIHVNCQTFHTIVPLMLCLLDTQ